MDEGEDEDEDSDDDMPGQFPIFGQGPAGGGGNPNMGKYHKIFHFLVAFPAIFRTTRLIRKERSHECRMNNHVIISESFDAISSKHR